MSAYREVFLSGWGITHSHQLRQHHWRWIGGREFQTDCGAHFTSMTRPREEASRTHCKACERKVAAQTSPSQQGEKP